MPGQRGRLTANPFHHVSVAANSVDVVIEHLEARAIVVSSQPLARDRHAYAVARALAERAGRGLDTRCEAILGMSGSLAVDLAEFLDVVQTDGGLVETLVRFVHCTDTGQIEQCV